MSSWWSSSTTVSSLWSTDHSPQLLNAVVDGNVETVQKLLESHPDLVATATNAQGWTALHLACFKGHVNIVELLLANTRNALVALVDAVTKDNGYTALHMASSKGHLVIVQRLVETGRANIETTTQHGKTTMHLACQSGRLDVLQYLVERLKLVSTKDAAEKTDASVKARVVGHLLNQTDASGNTVLHLASEAGHGNIVQFLVDHKLVNTEAVSGKGYTALHVAALQGQLPVLTYLIESNNGGVADESTANLGRNALHCASAAGQVATVKYLMDKGIVTVETTTDHKGWTALHIASYRGQVNVVKYLVEQQKANVEATTQDGNEWTAVHLAATNGSAEALQVLRYLIEHQGANVHVVDSKGQSPLAIARQKQRWNVVQYLEAKAKPCAGSVDCAEVAAP